MITGGDCLEAQAAVRLAVWAGAAGVFIVNSGKILSKRIHGGHVAVLSEDPKAWLPVVQGDMDLVIDFEYPRSFQSVIAAMARKGRLVCKYPEKDSHQHDSPTFMSKLVGQSALCAMSRASLFEFDDYVKANMEDKLPSRVRICRALVPKRQYCLSLSNSTSTVETFPARHRVLISTS